jgi:hypothetical protein
VNEDELRAGLQVLVQDSPDAAAIRAVVRARIDRRHRVRRTALVGAAAAAVSAIAIVATTLLTAPTDPADRTASYPTDAIRSPLARCYATADLQTDHGFLVVLAQNIDTGAPAPAGPHVLDLCAAQWAAGVLSSTAPHVRTERIGTPDTAPVPALATCVLPPRTADDNRLEVAAFPGDDTTCARLDLPSYGD